MIDIIRLYDDRGVEYKLPGHKHVSAGWVGVPCPFCSGNPGYHLGYCIDPGSKYAGRYVCWRCGPKKVSDVLCRILSLDKSGLRAILDIYQRNLPINFENDEGKKRERKSRLILPAGTGEMNKRHRQYLIDRKFDPDKLEKEWGLKGTGPVGPYKHRIIIPIEYKGQLVSYQGRDITGKSDMKYKACQQENEVRDHKDCLYGLDKARSNKVIVVEGVTDVWRMGPGSVATFGIKYKPSQVRLLLNFSMVFILFDPESEAQEQARKLGLELKTAGIQSELIDIGSGDPGELSEEEADYISLDLLGKKIN
jgi:DNA primase